MAENTTNTGDAGRLRIVVNVTGGSNAGNYTDIAWAAYLEERTTYNFSFSGGTTASVVIDGATVYSGSFTWDWRPGGLQNTLIASGTRRINHNSNGTKSVTSTLSMGATGTSGAGGPASVSLNNQTMPTRTVLPSVPSGLTAVRLSDTQIQLNWTGGGASNGQPTQNVIQRRENGGAWDAGTTISATTTATVSAAANEKWEFRVAAKNAAGTTSYSSTSTPVYTTPAAPSGVAAVKDSSLDINITFTSNVGYAEHEHEVWHGTVSGGVTTWDGSALTTLAGGVTSYTHTAPDPGSVHTYRVRAKAGALLSGYSQSGNVQLLVAPNAPTIPAMPAFADKASILTFNWQHNPVDTTAQTAYEFQYSTNGGSSWSGTGKVTSTAQSATRPANTYAANVVLTMRVRTWGQATTGGSTGTGASAWSELKAVTFKTVPTATITSPANGSTTNDSTLRVDLGFAQPESATFVKAQLELLEDAVLLEARESVTLLGTTFDTPVENEATYTVRARVQDSNGLWSAWVTSTFDVEYLAPVAPIVTVDYLSDMGFGQVNITLPAPGGGEAEVDTVTVTRTINGVREDVVRDYPADDLLAFFDTTPVINGTNTYRVTTTSELGAKTTVTVDMVTTECRRAFLSKGASYSNVVAFGGNLEVDIEASVANDTFQAAGRIKPIGMYGVETDVRAKVSSFVFAGFGSTIPELEAFLLVPGKACFRDASGRRMFGAVNGSVSYTKTDRGELNFALTETS